MVMHSELTTLWLAVRAIAKLSLTTGFGPWLVIMTAVHIGRTYRVVGLFPGDFIGRCIAIMNVGGKRFVQLLVTDTLFPKPRVRNKCPFPDCIREQDHSREHEFPRIRKDTFIDVPECNARFVEVEKEVA